MDDSPSYLATLMDLETRHDDLLQRLEELDQRVENVLAEWLATREPAVSPSAACPATG